MSKRLFILLLIAGAAPVHAGPRKQTVQKTPEQRLADRHFKSGVALFKEAKYTEALAEFERAYEVAPHPLVLYNIAGCHRELSHYSEAVTFYTRFLAEGVGKVPTARLSAAQAELDGILARIARVTVRVEPADGASLVLDGTPLGTLPLDMPLILPPGEHKLLARAAGRSDAERTLRLASGDELVVELALAALPEKPVPVVDDGGGLRARATPRRGPKRLAIHAGYGTNLRRAADTGVPAIGLGLALGSRLELGVDATLVAYSVIPSIRLRLAGHALAIHAIAAAPISFTDGDAMETFVAGGIGLGLRLRATPTLAFRLESYASFAGDSHGTTVPTFLGGELWF